MDTLMKERGEYKPQYCSKARPCNRWRDCYWCGRRRQAKIADAVEKLADKVGQLRWNILYPNIIGSAGIKKMRENWLRAAAPAGAIWTIEQSKKTNAYHCNIITPAETIYTPRQGHHWHQTISGNPRNVGAYISKQSQMPREQDYKGKLFGAAGPLWQFLTGSNIEPVVNAAAVQYTLDAHQMTAKAILQIEKANLLVEERTRTESQKNLSKWEKQERLEKQAGEKPLSYYREKAAHWLPDLLEYQKSQKA